MNNILTINQILKAQEYRRLHKSHVDKLVKYAEGVAYPPRLHEDINDPRLWKPGHWLWFINSEKSLGASNA